MKHKKILDEPLIVITGAAGFIGSGVVRYLNDQGIFNLLLVDDLKKTEKWKNLVKKTFVDLISKEDIFPWLEGGHREIEAFIHLGACANTVEEDADYLLENNYHFTVKLAEYALENGHRFIYASSAGTYGDGHLGFCDDHDLLESFKPLSMYAYSKHLFDLWAKRENVLDQIVGLKYFNVFGPNEYHKGDMSSMILKMTKKVQKEGKLQLFKSNDPKFGDGEQCRDFIYVKDVARMTSLFLSEKYQNVNGIFNIGRGKIVTWNALAKALFSALKKPVNVEYIDMPKGLGSQYQNYTCADMRKYFSYFPQVSLMDIETSVEDYVQNYLLRDERW